MSKLEEEIGRAIGREIRATEVICLGVCINLPYNPGWSNQEVYGEESYHLGKWDRHWYVRSG